MSQQKMLISIPGTAHDLSAELKKVNAPRVVRSVGGDFIMQVRVNGALKPTGEPTMAERLPFNSAGLIIWVDATTYIRMERAAIVRDGQTQPILLFEERRDSIPTLVGSFPIEARPLHLRLERREQQLFPSFSFDGVAWIPLRPYRTELPARVQVGVAAVSTAATPFTAELEGLTVYTRLDDAAPTK